MPEKKDIQIKLPYELAGKLSKRIQEVGFNSITEYIVYVLEQALSAGGYDEAYTEEDEKKVRERLKDLGYL